VSNAPDSLVIEEVERARSLLAAMVRMRGVPLQDLDQRTGHQRGYFSQILKGRLALRYRHIIEALHGINFEPATFFRLLYPPSNDRLSEADLYRSLSGLTAASASGSRTEGEGDQTTIEPVKGPAARGKSKRGKAKPKKAKGS